MHIETLAVIAHIMPYEKCIQLLEEAIQDYHKDPEKISELAGPCALLISKIQIDQSSLDKILDHIQKAKQAQQIANHITPQ